MENRGIVEFDIKCAINSMNERIDTLIKDKRALTTDELLDLYSNLSILKYRCKLLNLILKKEEIKTC